MKRRSFCCLGVAALAAASFALRTEAQTPAADRQGVQITQLTNRLRVEINGQLFTEYFFKDVPRPYCYPLIGPFWSEAKGFGKTVHDGFIEVKSGKDVGIIKERCKWVTAKGELVCTDERTLRIYNPGAAPERIFDFEITLRPAGGDLIFGDTKEGTMAVRLAETMRLKGKVGHGHIVNSAGVRDGETWGKRADWCDYYGPVDGKVVGIAIFDDPRNPRHPTTWHVRDYGLFAANPFGLHDFEKLSDKAAGDMVVPAGKSVTFRYRFYLHEGDDQQANVAEKYKAYVAAQDQR